MKIAITASQPNLEAEVDPRFGRCRWFIIIDPDTMQFEVAENESAMAGGGAGVSTSQTIVNQKVKAVLTGNCGPNAHQVLSASGIEVITGVSGKIKDIVEGYKTGRYQTSAQPNVAEHYGKGQAGQFAHRGHHGEH